MADENLRASLFGPSPEEVAMARRAQSQAYNTQVAAQVPLERMGVITMGNAGAALGRVAGNALGGRDPMQDKAAAMQEAKQEVMQSGISLMDNPQEYYKAAFVALSRRGLTDEAAKVRAMMQQEQSAIAKGQMDERKMRVDETKAGADLLTAQTGAYNAQKPAVTTASDLITLAPPGASSKGTGQEQTFDPNVPEQAAQMRELVNQGWVKSEALPSPDRTDPTLLGMSKILQGMAAGMERDAFRTVMGTVKPIIDDTHNRSIAADGIIEASDRAIDLIEKGKTTMGSAVGLRYAVTKFAELTVPDMADGLEESLKLNPTDVEAMEKVNAETIANLARSYSASGDRLSKSSIDLLRGAGPSAAMTNEGIYVTSHLLKARALTDKAIEEELAKYMAPREGETATSDSVATRMLSLPMYVNELKKKYKPSMFLPKDLEDKARIAVKKGTIPWKPVNPTDAKDGKVYRLRDGSGYAKFDKRTGKMIRVPEYGK